MQRFKFNLTVQIDCTAILLLCTKFFESLYKKLTSPAGNLGFKSAGSSFGSTMLLCNESTLSIRKDADNDRLRRFILFSFGGTLPSESTHQPRHTQCKHCELVKVKKTIELAARATQRIRYRLSSTLNC